MTYCADGAGGCEFVTWVGSTLTIACYGLVFRCLGCVGFGWLVVWLVGCFVVFLGLGFPGAARVVLGWFLWFWAWCCWWCFWICGSGLMCVVCYGGGWFWFAVVVGICYAFLLV